MKCRECKGNGKLICPVCNGSKIDPRTDNETCGHCNGTGYIACSECLGKGNVPYSHANL